MRVPRQVHTRSVSKVEEISNLLPGVPIVLNTMYGSEVCLKAPEHGISWVVEKAKSNALVAAVEELLATDIPQP